MANGKRHFRAVTFFPKTHIIISIEEWENVPRMVSNRENNKMNKKNIFSIFPLLCLILLESCSSDLLNNKVLEMKTNEESSIAELTKDKSGKMYVLRGNLSEQNFMKFCKKIKRRRNYDSWGIALLLVDNKETANIYFINPYYGWLDTLYVDIKIEQGIAYSPQNIKIKRVDGKHTFVMYKSE